MNKTKAISADPDDQVISMVNRGTEEHERAAKNRAILKRLAMEQRTEAEKAQAEALLRTLVEAASGLCVGGLVLTCLVGGGITPGLAVPLVIVSFGWTGIRLDRYLRRQ